jgi:hypothetical protein
MKLTSFLIACLAFTAVVSVGNANETIDKIKAKFAQGFEDLKELADRIKNGESPVEIIKKAIHDHPDIVNKLDVFHQICPRQQPEPGTVADKDFVKNACAFIEQHYATLKEEVAKYKKEIHDKLEPVKQAIHDKLEPVKQEIHAKVDPYKQALEDKLAPYKKEAEDWIAKHKKEFDDWVASHKGKKE